MTTIDYQEFEKVDLRIGTIIEVEDFPQARKPAYKLVIDLGPEYGMKQSSAQITQLYTKQDLIGKQVLCVCNFAAKQIGPFLSEILTTGCNNQESQVVLVQPDHKVPNGSKLY